MYLPNRVCVFFTQNRISIQIDPFNRCRLTFIIWTKWNDFDLAGFCDARDCCIHLNVPAQSTLSSLDSLPIFFWKKWKRKKTNWIFALIFVLQFSQLWIRVWAFTSFYIEYTHINISHFLSSSLISFICHTIFLTFISHPLFQISVIFISTHTHINIHHPLKSHPQKKNEHISASERAHTCTHITHQITYTHFLNRKLRNLFYCFNFIDA